MKKFFCLFLLIVAAAASTTLHSSDLTPEDAAWAMYSIVNESGVDDGPGIPNLATQRTADDTRWYQGSDLSTPTLRESFAETAKMMLGSVGSSLHIVEKSTRQINSLATYNDAVDALYRGPFHQGLQRVQRRGGSGPLAGQKGFYVIANKNKEKVVSVGCSASPKYTGDCNPGFDQQGRYFCGYESPLECEETPTNLPMFQGFDTWVPTGWAITNDGVHLGFEQGSLNYAANDGPSAYSSTDATGSCSDPYDHQLISPPLLSSSNGIRVEADINYQNFAAIDDFWIEYSSDGVFWTLALDWSEDHGPFGGCCGDRVDITVPITSGHVRFRYFDTSGCWNWYVDIDNVNFSSA